MAQIPALYETDHILAEDKLVPLHYFSAAGDWWVTEIGMEDGEPIAFGYVKLAGYTEGAEWGYTDLAELEQVNVHRGLVIVERDCFWTPRKFGEIKKAQR